MSSTEGKTLLYGHSPSGWPWGNLWEAFSWSFWNYLFLFFEIKLSICSLVWFLQLYTVVPVFSPPAPSFCSLGCLAVAIFPALFCDQYYCYLLSCFCNLLVSVLSPLLANEVTINRDAGLLLKSEFDSLLYIKSPHYFLVNFKLLHDSPPSSFLPRKTWLLDNISLVFRESEVYNTNLALNPLVFKHPTKLGGLLSWSRCT